MARQRHWVNPMEPGAPCFVTTTVLDFVHAFHRAEARDCMLFHLVRECKLERAALYAYVIMPHHIHMIVRPRPDQTISQFMARFKPHTGDAVLRTLSLREKSGFDQQRGLNGNTFWQRSFRGLLIQTEEMFWQKAEYIHWNPVKAGYAAEPEQYIWSSAALYLKGSLSRETGLPYDAVMDSLRAWSDKCESERNAHPEA